MKKKFLVNGREYSLEIINKSEDSLEFKLGDNDYSFSKRSSSPYVLSYKESLHKAYVAAIDPYTKQVMVDHLEAVVEQVSQRGASSKAVKSGMTAPMPGKVFKVLCKEGQEVKEGDAILVLEAMKMEHTIRADKDGTVKKILFKEGDMVKGGAELVSLKGSED